MQDESNTPPPLPAIPVLPGFEAVDVAPEVTPAAPVAPVQADPAAELLDLPALAQEHGQLAPAAADGGRYLWRHNVASYLHGWGSHEYHQAKLVTMTRADYKAALDAVDTQTTHAPAVRKADEA